LIKLVKKILKLTEGILIIFLPVVIFYWILSLINLDFINPITTALGSYLEPIMAPLRSFLKLKIKYNNSHVDYFIILYAIFIVMLAYILNFIGKGLSFLENTIDKVKLNIKKQERARMVEQERFEQKRELDKNNNFYVALKIIKHQPKETYLLKSSDEDVFSVGLVDSYETSIQKFCTKFSGRLYGKIVNSKNVYGIIFDDVNKLLDYLSALHPRIIEINKGMLDLNIKFEYKIACHCSYSDASADIDFDILNKIINLCGVNDILLSELLKCKLENYEYSKKFRIFSRGIYLIKDKQVDLFKLGFEE